MKLRAKYWIIHGCSFVRKVLHKCVTCHHFEGRAHYPPPPPPLPAFRVKGAPAFTYTGVDYAGPLYVKGPNNSKESKVWICLYTCCIVRAIHLEVVPHLTTQSFIWCFKRFTARRGFLVEMISDNGKTFKVATKLLLDIVKHPEVGHCLSETHIQWVSSWRELHSEVEFSREWWSQWNDACGRLLGEEGWLPMNWR